MEGVSARRGEGTKTILVFGDAGERLVPFVFDSAEYRAPAKLLRHHPGHPDCAVIEEALRAPKSWKSIETKGAGLRASTVRCTGGCWDAYEASEQRRIARGDENARADCENDGQLAEQTPAGLVPTPLAVELGAGIN